MAAAVSSLPLYFFQAFLPLCVLYPVTDNSPVFSDVIFKSLRRKFISVRNPSVQTDLVINGLWNIIIGMNSK